MRKSEVCDVVDCCQAKSGHSQPQWKPARQRTKGGGLLLHAGAEVLDEPARADAVLEASHWRFGSERSDER